MASSRLAVFLLSLAAWGCVALLGVLAAQEIPTDAQSGWAAYLEETERQIAAEFEQASVPHTFDRLDSEELRSCRGVIASGDICAVSLKDIRLERKSMSVEDALVHHWYASARIPAVTLNETLDFVRAYEDYPRYFDEVNSVDVVEREGDSLRARLQITRKKVLTVHYNLDQHAVFTRRSPTQASARIVTTRIRELEDIGGANEREKPSGDDRGFLWALNAYWKYTQVGDDVILEAEVVRRCK